jgi:hypothetical protein
MPAEVRLHVTNGKLKGRVYTFAERTTCIIGRASDCNLQLSDDEAHRKISRHHCLLDINPPDVTVRDFGSLNGTYVNGKKIGQRERGQSPTEAAQLDFPEHALTEGDEIQLSDTVFRLSLYVPLLCPQCGAEFSGHEDQKAQSEGVFFLCEVCRQRIVQLGTNETMFTETQRPACAKCGKDVMDEIGQRLQGEYLCASCQANPLALVKFLMERAAGGQQDVRAIKGYHVEYDLGQGGMGAVYLARHEGTGEQVALKVMLPRVAVSPGARAMFEREIANASALNHPHVVAVRASGFSQGMFYYTMEYCDGGTVKDLMLERGGTLSVDEALDLTLQALAGLAYVHHAEIPHITLKDGRTVPGKGLVHRDLKPTNIFLMVAGRKRIAKIADVGLAKAFDQAGLSGLTRTGAVGGTPGFMPRQQVINFKHAQPEVDVWAMAASLYYMLTGAVPRDFPVRQDKWLVVLQSAAVPIRRRKRTLPRKLAEVIDAALMDRPQITFQSALAFKQALEQSI